MPLLMQLLCFLCSAKINVVNTDLICLVTTSITYSNLLIQFKNWTENMMRAHAGLYKGKNAPERLKKSI